MPNTEVRFLFAVPILKGEQMTLSDKLNEVERKHRRWRDALLDDLPESTCFKLYQEYVHAIQQAQFHGTK